MIHGEEFLAMLEVPEKPVRPEALEFYISPVDFVDDEHALAGGVIMVNPDNPMQGEEMRFNTALQTGKTPEAVKIPYYDGLPLDAATAYRTGQTALAFAASRWHLPPHPETDEPEPPTLL